MLLEETIALKGSTGNGEIARLIVWCNNDIIIYLEFAEIPTANCTLTDSKNGGKQTTDQKRVCRLPSLTLVDAHTACFSVRACRR